MTTPTQLKLGLTGTEEIQKTKKPELSNGRTNKLDQQDRAFHDWYRFVLSFPPHLVRDYIQKFDLNQKSLVVQRDFIVLRDFGWYYETLRLQRFEV